MEHLDASEVLEVLLSTLDAVVVQAHDCVVAVVALERSVDAIRQWTFILADKVNQERELESVEIE